MQTFAGLNTDFFLRYEVVFNKKGNNELYKNLFGILLEISG